MNNTRTMMVTRPSMGQMVTRQWQINNTRSNANRVKVLPKRPAPLNFRSMSMGKSMFTPTKPVKKTRRNRSTRKTRRNRTRRSNRK